MKKYFFTGIAMLLTVPIRAAFAAVGSFRELVLTIVSFLSKQIMPLLVLVGLFYFMFNLVQFIRKSDNKEEQKKFGPYVGYSLLAVFVMLAVWGIVGLLVRSVFPDGTVFIG